IRRSRRLALAATTAAEVGFERRFGPTLDYENIPPSNAAQVAGLPVARLVDIPQAGFEEQGFATGFLVSSQLLLTNYHVFSIAADAENAGAEFEYEYEGTRLKKGTTFVLDPQRFFLSNKDLDFALVAVSLTSQAGRQLRDYSFLRMIPTSGKILKGHPVNLIEYPDGAPKTYVSKNNPLVNLDDNHLWYLS